MKFTFDLSHAASGNSEKAVVRESTRMACIAWCLRELGHEVSLDEKKCPKSVKKSPRWVSEPFLSLPKEPVRGGVVVCAERQPNVRGNCVVRFKTSVNCRQDARNLFECDVLMAHEYDPSIGEHKKLLPIPFLVHDRVIEWFIESGQIEAYLRNELERFRGEPSPGKIGFIGYGGYGRKQAVSQITEALQNLQIGVSAEFYDTPPYNAQNYMDRVKRFEWGLLPHGDTPKSNRFSEYALLGVPMIAVPRPVRDTPDLDSRNCIMLRDWSDRESFVKGASRRDEILKNADECYKNGWSPLGQARLLVDKLKRS